MVMHFSGWEYTDWNYTIDPAAAKDATDNNGLPMVSDDNPNYLMIVGHFVGCMFVGRRHDCTTASSHVERVSS